MILHLKRKNKQTNKGNHNQSNLNRHKYDQEDEKKAH